MSLLFGDPSENHDGSDEDEEWRPAASLDGLAGSQPMTPVPEGQIAKHTRAMESLVDRDIEELEAVLAAVPEKWDQSDPIYESFLHSWRASQSNSTRVCAYVR
jgi:hypothetical protein